MIALLLLLPLELCRMVIITGVVEASSVGAGRCAYRILSAFAAD